MDADRNDKFGKKSFKCDNNVINGALRKYRKVCVHCKYASFRCVMVFCASGTTVVIEGTFSVIYYLAGFF